MGFMNGIHVPEEEWLRLAEQKKGLEEVGMRCGWGLEGVVLEV